MIVIGLISIGIMLLVLGACWFLIASQKHLTELDRETHRIAGTICLVFGLLVVVGSLWADAVLGWV